MIVGCLPPFKSLLSSKSSADNTYALSEGRLNPSSVTKRSRRSFAGAGWHDMPVPLQSRATYRNLDEGHYYETSIESQSDGREAKGSPLSRGKSGKIMVVEEFVSPRR